MSEKKTRNLNPKSLENIKKSQFKPGQSGNPSGKPKDPIRAALRNLTIKEYRDVIELAMVSNLQALQDLIKDPNTSAVQVGVGTAMIKAIKNGDINVIERLAERLVGKIPDKLEVTSNNKSVVTNIDQAKLAEAIKQLENDV